MSFTRFGAIMAIPWLAAIAVEYLIFRLYFASDLRVTERRPQRENLRVPFFALTVVVATLGGFVVASALGVNPAWAAFTGAIVLAVRAMSQGRVTPRVTPAQVLRSADLPFGAFVLALGVVVAAVVGNGRGDAVRPLVSHDTSLPGMLAVAVLAGVLANLLNNLPTVLLLLPAAAGGLRGQRAARPDPARQPRQRQAPL